MQSVVAVGAQGAGKMGWQGAVGGPPTTPLGAGFEPSTDPMEVSILGLGLGFSAEMEEMKSVGLRIALSNVRDVCVQRGG